MRVNRDGFNQVTTFENAEDLLRRAQSPCLLDERNRASLRESFDFTNTHTLDEAIGLARKGWTGGIEMIKTMRADVNSRLNGSVPLPEMQFGVRGQRVHMGKFMAGNPKPMMSIVDTEVMLDSFAPRVLTLTCNIAASAAVSQDTMMRRAAGMIVLVDVLQRRRYRLNIDLVMAVTTRVLHGQGSTLEYRLRVKQASEFTSIDKLAFFLGHNSSLRRIMFALMEHEPDDIRQHYGIGWDNRGAYGIPGTTDKVGDIHLDRILAPTDWSDSLTMAWLTKALASQGITLRGKAA